MGFDFVIQYTNLPSLVPIESRSPDRIPLLFSRKYLPVGVNFFVSAKSTFDPRITLNLLLKSKGRSLMERTK